MRIFVSGSPAAILSRRGCNATCTTPIRSACPASCGCSGPVAAGGTSTSQGTRQASPIGAGSATGIGRRATAARRTLLNLLTQSKRLDRSLISLDGTLIPGLEFLEQTGYSGKHRTVGTKLSLLVDRGGTPLAVSVAPGIYHDGALGF